MKIVLSLLMLLITIALLAENTTEQGPGSVPNPNPNGPTGYERKTNSCIIQCTRYTFHLPNGTPVFVYVEGEWDSCESGTASSCLATVCDADCGY